VGLLLLVFPIQSAQGQEEPLGDPGAETFRELVEENPEIDVSALPYQMYLPSLQGAGEVENEEENSEPAFTDTVEMEPNFTENPWVQPPVCFGVLPAERIFLDDMPGGLPPSPETGLLSFVENSVGDETCSSSVPVAPLVSSTAWPRLFVRYALNDSAHFWVRVWRAGFLGQCNSVLALFSTALDDSLWRVGTVNLPPGFAICRVEIILSDELNNSAGEQTSVLIDYIQFRNNAGAINPTWHETFTGP